MMSRCSPADNWLPSICDRAGEIHAASGLPERFLNPSRATAGRLVKGPECNFADSESEVALLRRLYLAIPKPVATRSAATVAAPRPNPIRYWLRVLSPPKFAGPLSACLCRG